ncbi:hypothetical protein D3C84_1314010 [compost metagenome]
MIQGAQANAQSLSTAGPTVNVGKYSASLQQDPTAAQVGQLALQRLNLLFSQSQQQVDAIGCKVFFQY